MTISSEPKRCVGIYYVNLMSDPVLLRDTGMRFYIDPENGELISYGVTDELDQRANEFASDLMSLEETDTMNADQFLSWCLTDGNEFHVLGSSRWFAVPSRVPPESISPDPNAKIMSDMLAALGM